MAENTGYFDAIVAHRAMQLDEQDALEGQTLVSAETQADLTDSGILNYIHDNFASFLTHIRYLSVEDQELLLAYYLLGKTQTQLARLFHVTQTVCSSKVRLAVKRLCAFIMLGVPSEQTMEAVLTKAGLESSLEGVPLSRAIALYAQTRSFEIAPRIVEI